jgi:hypothetical protein
MPVSHHARRRSQNAQDKPQHRALAAAALTEDHESISAINFEIDPIQDGLLTKTQYNIFEMNQWRFAHPVILVTITLNNVSNPITVVIEITTLSVVAFPTPSAPPLTVSPW